MRALLLETRIDPTSKNGTIGTNLASEPNCNQENSMTKRNVLTGVALCAAFALGGALFAQAPPVDVGDRHGNMRAAQQLIQQAWQKVDEAQQDNHYNLGGHAGRAKELLSQASQEIKLSAEAANEHR
jgi:apolipoprotein N-acyltransferase